MTTSLITKLRITLLQQNMHLKHINKVWFLFMLLFQNSFLTRRSTILNPDEYETLLNTQQLKTEVRSYDVDEDIGSTSAKTSTGAIINPDDFDNLLNKNPVEQKNVTFQPRHFIQVDCQPGFKLIGMKCRRFLKGP